MSALRRKKIEKASRVLLVRKKYGKQRAVRRFEKKDIKIELQSWLGVGQAVTVSLSVGRQFAGLVGDRRLVRSKNLVKTKGLRGVGALRK